MSNRLRRIGDNQNAVTNEAIKFVRKIYEALNKQKTYCELAFKGKNKTIRDVNALMSLKQNADTLNSLKDWADIIEAKEENKDIHAGALKSKKLNIVAGAESNFAQYIIDKEVK